MKDDNVLLIVGGAIAAFAVYELVIKPKTTAVSTAVPVGTGTTVVTQSKLPVATATSPIQSLSNALASLFSPAGSTPNANNQLTAADGSATNFTDLGLSSGGSVSSYAIPGYSGPSGDPDLALSAPPAITTFQIAPPSNVSTDLDFTRGADLTADSSGVDDIDIGAIGHIRRNFFEG